jgi:iron complex transport system substrate-binding protein
MSLSFKIYTPLLFFLLFSCKPATEKLAIQPDSTLQITHAKGFRIEYFNDYKKVTVFNPWKNNVIYDCYYLVNHQQYKTPSDGKKIVIPIGKIALTSGTQLSFFNLLNEDVSIIGIAAPHLIYDTEIQTKIREKRITDLGDPFNLNIEKIHLTKPDALIVSGFDSNAGKDLIANIPTIYDNEWMEETLLARAEWIKFIAAFYNKESLADSIFSSIEKKYTNVLSKTKNLKYKPTVLCGGNFRGTWYMPGGNSYMANLLKDAGANYFYQNNDSQESLPLNFEVVLNNFRHADCWIGAPANSLPELFQIDDRHKLFDAAQKQQVFSFNARMNASGANDFWESGITSPDRILEDLIWVFHPERMTDYTPFYVERLR